MRKLSYKTLNDIGNEDYYLKSGVTRVLQFGEGNFLRGFADYFIDVANEKLGLNTLVTVVQPIAQGLSEVIREQDGLYTLYLRGAQDGKATEQRRLISCIGDCINPYSECAHYLKSALNPDIRYIISNTTEAGIVYTGEDKMDDAPAASFPGKLTQWLHHRYMSLGQQDAPGCVVLACELIDNNGAKLAECVESYAKQWGLEPEFSAWLKDKNLFCSTLVDRIVTGYPKGEADKLNEQNQYEDQLLDTAELFGLWVIEGPSWLADELPFAKAGLPVLVVDDHAPYKKRKVRILNGAHTSMVLAAYLAGQDIVRGCMEDEQILGFLRGAIFDEIIPTLTLPKQELEKFADDVLERFRNPYIDHALLSISLNSVSKWRARVLPSLKEYAVKFGKLPKRLTFSFAALLVFYAGNQCGREYKVVDDAFALNIFAEHSIKKPNEYVVAAASDIKLWGEDLTKIPGFAETISAYLTSIKERGMVKAMTELEG